MDVPRLTSTMSGIDALTLLVALVGLWYYLMRSKDNAYKVQEQIKAVHKLGQDLIGWKNRYHVEEQGASKAFVQRIDRVGSLCMEAKTQQDVREALDEIDDKLRPDMHRFEMKMERESSSRRLLKIDK